MNYVNMVKSRYMKQLISICLTAWLLPSIVLGQERLPVLTLDTILNRIERNNILLQSYALKAESYKYSAAAATAWMAPMAGIGTFMTPYPGQKIMDGRDKGNIMLQIEQDIPNPAKQNAKKRYIESQAGIENANRAITYNDFRAQAKRLYYNWLIAQHKIGVLRESVRIMSTMKKIEEVRYPYNQSQLSNVYKADVKIEESRNMIRMQEGIISRSHAWLNTLMNAPAADSFQIDTIAEPHFAPTGTFDTSSLALVRKDVVQMNERIQSMRLNIESMQMERKPDFRIRFDHMSPLSGMMPKAFSIMGMVSIPIAPWASRMYKSEIKSMEYNIRGMEKERSGMLQETQGMLYGMQSDIQAMHDRVAALEEKIIPALQKVMDANYLLYQENKLALSAMIDAWEALNMMQLNLLDEKLKHYEMIIEYEKELYR